MNLKLTPKGQCVFKERNRENKRTKEKAERKSGHREMVSGRFGGSDRSPETEALKRSLHLKP